MSDNNEILIEIADSLAVICVGMKELVSLQKKTSKRMSKIESGMSVVSEYFLYERELAEKELARREMESVESDLELQMDWIGKDR